MMLLTKDITSKLPILYSQENEQDPMVIVKFFAMFTSWKWYAIEFDGKDLFFGYVSGHEIEFDIQLPQIKTLYESFGIPMYVS